MYLSYLYICICVYICLTMYLYIIVCVYIYTVSMDTTLLLVESTAAFCFVLYGKNYVAYLFGKWLVHFLLLVRN